MAIGASCCWWCVPSRPPTWAPITASAQTRWAVPRAHCGYTVRIRNLGPAISRSLTDFNLFCLLGCGFCIAEIKLHPGASASNDDHLNYIGGKVPWGLYIIPLRTLSKFCLRLFQLLRG